MGAQEGGCDLLKEMFFCGDGSPKYDVTSNKCGFGVTGSTGREGDVYSTLNPSQKQCKQS